MYQKIFKRIFDSVISFIGCIFLFPILLVLAIAIKIDSRGPILFMQKRVGQNKSHFMILKFRTMRVDTPKDMPTHLLKNPDQYITKVGKFLRKTSLDELPQILNILWGDMAIVGPRPALWNQYDLIKERDKYGANNLRPGLTGWAQINGRDEISIEEKARLDGEYAQKLSFIFDLRCIVKTFSSVLKSEGVLEGGTGNDIKMMQKVFIIVNHNITLYSFRKELVESLVEKGYEVTVLLPVTDDTEKIKALGCKVIDVPVERRGTNPIHDYKLLRSYYKILGHERPDIVLTYTIKPNVYGGLACSLRKIPYLSTITGLGTAIEGGGLLKMVSLLLYKVGLNKAKVIFFQNNYNKKLFEDFGIGRKTGKLINGSGVNISSYENIPFPEKDSSIEFLFISRIMKSKGIEEFLETAQKIKQKYPESRFHILGFCEDDYQERLKNLTKRGTVCYHGMQEDIGNYMQKVQCLIHPSYHEGMSNVCMEAAASGRAVIASNIAGCKELVDDGISGILVEAQSAQALFEGVDQFISLPYEVRKEMGRSGKEKMKNDFDRSKIVEEYLKQIKKYSKVPDSGRSRHDII